MLKGVIDSQIFHWMYLVLDYKQMRR
jgi:hypothetical protein